MIFSDSIYIDIQDLYSGNILALSRAITLLESKKKEHREFIIKLLSELKKQEKTYRIAVTGIPGSGKSTFIEKLGCLLVDNGYKVAVLAIDPTSHLSGGSILGDKTRMEELSRNKNAFIRPTPSSGVLGGVADTTYETMCLCEAAGYDVIFIETVGVGQSEVSVTDLCDFSIFVTVPGTGDDLQALKRGIMETADFVFINKADNDYIKKKAMVNQMEIMNGLSFINPKYKDWKIPVEVGSALIGENLLNMWSVISNFYADDLYKLQIMERRGKNEALRMEYWFEYLLLEKIKKSILFDVNSFNEDKDNMPMVRVYNYLKDKSVSIS